MLPLGLAHLFGRVDVLVAYAEDESSGAEALARLAHYVVWHVLGREEILLALASRRDMDLLALEDARAWAVVDGIVRTGLARMRLGRLGDFAVPCDSVDPSYGDWGDVWQEEAARWEKQMSEIPERA